MEWVFIIAIAFLLSIVIRTYVLDTRIVPTGSMLPTIQLQDRLIVDKFVYKFKPLERGDVIVFKAPDSADEDLDLVKRLIGLPGEEVQIKDGKVWIDGKCLNEPYVSSPPNYEYGPVVVPEGQYFFLGDNRNQSKDSHIWGFMPSENVLGRVWVRYWPLSGIGHLQGAPDPYFCEESNS